MATPDPPEIRAILGATILKRYQHPGSWITGETVNHVAYSGCMLLRVEEFRVGQYAEFTPAEAQRNAADIMAFLHTLGLTEQHVWFVSEPDKAPYLVVPTAAGNWDMVVAMLSNL